MEINLFINDDTSDSNIVFFCNQSKRFKFLFKELSQIKLLYNQRKLIILKENILIDKFINKLKKSDSFFSLNTCFFLSNKHKKFNPETRANIISYPLKFDVFENYLLKIFKLQKIKYKNLELRNDSTLFNKKNKKHIYLTEIESKIVIFLFENNFVEKKVLNKSVLNQSPLIDSKSLESHLYRLRKKLNIIDSTKEIVVIKNQGLKII